MASSWRNAVQPGVVAALRAAGHEVYDFRNPGSGLHGFSWSEIDPEWRSWSAEEYAAALEHPAAVRGFGADFAAMQWADTCVLVQPCGRSAHLELGWAVGAGKRTAILQAEGQEPELMVKMVDLITTDLDALLSWLVQPLVVRRNKWADGSYQEVYTDGSTGPWVPPSTPTVLPSRDEVHDVVCDEVGWLLDEDKAKLTDAILARLASQPTVASVKAEAWDEGYRHCFDAGVDDEVVSLADNPYRKAAERG